MPASRASEPSPPDTVTYLDAAPGGASARAFTAAEQAVLERVNQKIAARSSLADVVDYLFDETRELIPCDRLSFALVDEGTRVTSHFTRADYEPLLLQTGYSEELHRGSLERVLAGGVPRIIDDLRAYATAHPESRSARLLSEEGARSSLTAPLTVDGRVVGFLFRNSHLPGVYTRRHARLTSAITERLSQAVEKALLIEQLREANRSYFELLGFVSHEIKSPVASLVTDARMLAEGYYGEIPAQPLEKVRRIGQKGEYLLDLVREYLDLARVESGELILDARPDVDVLGEVITPSVDMMTSPIEAAHMRLSTELPQPPVTAACDPALLRVVVTNLLSNAVKYGRESGELRLTVRREPHELAVRVWNEGPGFPPAQRGLLFRRFSRLTTPELRKRRGTGLGLYNARRIILLHGGRVGADSLEGAWAEFWFSIPQPLGDGPAAITVRGGAS
jgi:signal transduction histidine kinase